MPGKKAKKGCPTDRYSLLTDTARNVDSIKGIHMQTEIQQDDTKEKSIPLEMGYLGC